MSTQKRNFPVLAVLGGLIVLAVFIRLATAVDLSEDPLTLAASTQHATGHSEASEPTESLRTELGALPCFRECHNFERFDAGGDFPHSIHLEQEIGHCHMCHAFDGHFEASVREEICEDCH
ncbi:MAG: hypothetical protein AUK47_22815 [Deltaproteobacteria bacterium CG2_30_63_29]|nr:MAG: hypothetical protein AUK47_22815 [Deltaproteobacteria bacterium CG2_30_63_29]PJB37030.1 MAG: hypothetical protein CO108_22100 [Deltaproteobacteria bacterium CG_4_9_14_3_um_filter_63_12]